MEDGSNVVVFHEEDGREPGDEGTGPWFRQRT
jgi:hypothetical protein